MSNTFLRVIVFSFLLPLFVSAQSVATSSNRYIVPLKANQSQVLQNLFEQKYISSISTFSNFTITPGAYKISTSSSKLENEKILKQKPYMKWVVVPPGLRKEEIANLLQKELGWTKKQKDKFLRYTNLNYNELEGVYFPETYLIPTDEDPSLVQKRFVNKFNENFKSYLPKFREQNFPWMKALTLASLVEREASNKEDMPLIAGILINRIDQKMPLGVDATLQYIRGDKGKGYWAPITVADKKIKSSYNTYTKTGLPPFPISNPSLAAIDAVLNPATTTCLYYIHDNNRNTHCAETYAKHLENIDIYLKK